MWHECEFLPDGVTISTAYEAWELETDIQILKISHCPFCGRDLAEEADSEDE